MDLELLCLFGPKDALTSVKDVLMVKLGVLQMVKNLLMKN
ncbi:hypothetical protein SDC9_134396 [bioreactor metagenome]|uniref:Uncharacterized protein n=1 Tax=bioreactor metagenome TaxID=1076179 RepID=A0A645DCT8_9ZZZZ